MSSILDALRKVEREKAEVAQAVEVDFDEAAAERDLIGGTDGRGRMVLHLPPWVLMALGGAFVLAVVASAGMAWLWLRGPVTEAPVAVASHAPVAVTAPAPAPKPEPPAPAIVETVPVQKQPEPEVVVAKAPVPEPPVVEPVKPEPPAQEVARVENPAPKPEPPVAKEVLPEKSEETPKPIAKALKERIEAEPEKAAREEPKPQDKPAAEEVEPAEEAAVKPVEPKVEPEPEAPKPEAVQLAKAETAPEPLPDLPTPPPVVVPTIGEPLKSAPREPEPVEAAVPAQSEKADEGAVLPPSEEDRRLIKLNMPRPANKRNPYASAIINLQPVFLNEMIPGTTAKLVGVQEKGVIILKQDTGTRHFIPF